MARIFLQGGDPPVHRSRRTEQLEGRAISEQDAAVAMDQRDRVRQKVDDGVQDLDVDELVQVRGGGL